MPVVFNGSKLKKRGKIKKGRDWKRLFTEGHPLASFINFPLNIRFATQGEKEKIVLLLRRHPITNFFWVTASIVTFFLPFFLFPTFFVLRTFPSFIPPAYFIVGLAFWYIGTIGFVLLNFLLWYFNVNIITDQRIIDIDFIYLLYHESTETRISRVEDVTYKRGGLARAIFNYGDVFIQTAGTEPNIEFLAIPDPAKVVKKIVELMPQRAG